MAVALSPEGTGPLALRPVIEDHRLLHEGSRLLLAVSVMAVALRYPFRDVRRRFRPVLLRLLAAVHVPRVMEICETSHGAAVRGVTWKRTDGR